MDDLVKTLNERRLKLVSDMRAILDRADENGVLPAEDEEQYQRLNEQVSALGERITELVGVAKANQNIDEYREEYERLVSPKDRKDAKRKETDFLRSFASTGIGTKLTFDGYFQSMVRHIDPKTGSIDVHAALGEDAAATGGNLVPTDFLNILYQHMIHASAIRQTNVRVLRTSSGRAIQMPKTASHGTAVWVGEGTAITGSNPSFGQLTLNAYKVAQIVSVSNELLEDQTVDLSGYLAEDLGRAIGEAEGARFVTGSGTNTPRGLLTAIKADIGTAVQIASASIEVLNLLDLFYDVTPPYRANGFWFMSDDAAKDVRSIRDANGNLVWNPSIVAGQPDALFGRPIVVDPNMPAVGSAASSIAFGDFSTFVIREDGDPELFYTEHRYADTDQVAWRVTHRVDSDLLDTRGLDILDTD